MRMMRSRQWDASVLVDEMSRDVLGWLPAPADGVMHLSADKTREDKRSRKHPLGLVTRESKHSPYHFGFEMVLLIASWGSLSHSASSSSDGHQGQRTPKYLVSAYA